MKAIRKSMAYAALKFAAACMPKSTVTAKRFNDFVYGDQRTRDLKIEWQMLESRTQWTLEADRPDAAAMVLASSAASALFAASGYLADDQAGCLRDIHSLIFSIIDDEITSEGGDA